MILLTALVFLYLLVFLLKGGIFLFPEPVILKMFHAIDRAWSAVIHPLDVCARIASIARSKVVLVSLAGLFIVAFIGSIGIYIGVRFYSHLRWMVE